MNKVLLTGGSGMVGRNFLEHEGIEKFEVFAPTRKDLDLMDSSAVDQYVNDIKPDLVVHAAGVVGGIQANISNPIKFLTENVIIGINIILAAHKAGVTKLLNLGSSCMYPKDCSGSLVENQILTGPLEPTNEGYAIAKITAAKLCSYVNREDSTRLYKTIIPCNLYGPYDKFSPTNSHLIPAIIVKTMDAISTGSNEIEIWGDGEARREFMFVGDLVNFVFRSLDNFNDLPELMNVGLGFDYTINEYYRSVGKVLDYKGDYVHDLDRPVGMKRKVTNVKKLEDFGWVAPTSLELGIKNTIEYYKSEFL